jgi:DNA-directed RNA polymerase subunit omega
MNHPSIDVLFSKVDSKYNLAVLGGRRARKIVNGSEPLVECRSSKPVTIALEEIAQGKIIFQQTKDSIK